MDGVKEKQMKREGERGRLSSERERRRTADISAGVQVFTSFQEQNELKAIEKVEGSH